MGEYYGRGTRGARHTPAPRPTLLPPHRITATSVPQGPQAPGMGWPPHLLVQTPVPSSPGHIQRPPHLLVPNPMPSSSFSSSSFTSGATISTSFPSSPPPPPAPLPLPSPPPPAASARAAAICASTSMASSLSTSLNSPCPVRLVWTSRSVSERQGLPHSVQTQRRTCGGVAGGGGQWRKGGEGVVWQKGRVVEEGGRGGRVA